VSVDLGVIIFRSVHEVSVSMPKRPNESRPPFPGDLAEELLRVARERGRPESDLAPLLQALAREWIEKGSYRRREEELEEILDRLSAVEDQLRAYSDRLAAPPSRYVVEEDKKTMPVKLDNVARRVLDHLTSIADEDGITPKVSRELIAMKVGRPRDNPTGKQITMRIDKLIAMGFISIEEDSGGGGGRRYRVEPSDR
jgi:hypothetical protein